MRDSKIISKPFGGAQVYPKLEALKYLVFIEVVLPWQTYKLTIVTKLFYNFII